MTAPDPTASIGIFDSGIGGLTVMRALRELLPHENIVYFGDTARLPYGNKAPETILRYTLEGSAFLEKQKIKMLIIACNTACSAGLETLRTVSNVPVVSVSEEGIEEVIRLFPEKKIGLLATKATILSEMFQKQILSRSPKTELFPIPCPLFVPLVEEGYLEHPICALAIQEYLLPLKKKSIDAVLLGCTHYPLLHSAIQQELGASVLLINPASACAQKAYRILAESGLLNPNPHPPHYQYYVSEDPEKFCQNGKTFLGFPIEHVHHQRL